MKTKALKLTAAFAALLLSATVSFGQNDNSDKGDNMVKDAACGIVTGSKEAVKEATNDGNAGAASRAIHDFVVPQLEKIEKEMDCKPSGDGKGKD